MSVVRGTGMSNYPSLVAESAGNPAILLRAAGIRRHDVGNYEAFIPFRAAIQVIESAAEATATPDFGAAGGTTAGHRDPGAGWRGGRTVATVADAPGSFNTDMAAYSRVAIQAAPLAAPHRACSNQPRAVR